MSNKEDSSTVDGGGDIAIGDRASWMSSGDSRREYGTVTGLPDDTGHFTVATRTAQRWEMQIHRSVSRKEPER